MDVTMAAVSDDVCFGPDPAGLSAGGQLDIIGVFDQVWSERVPCRVPRACVSVGFSADATEFGQHVMMRVQLLAPDGSVIEDKQDLYTVNTPPHREYAPAFREPLHFLPRFLLPERSTSRVRPLRFQGLGRGRASDRPAYSSEPIEEIILTDELMKRMNEGQTILVSEMEDDGPFVVIAAPRIGTPPTEEPAPSDLASQRTPRPGEIA